MYETWTTIENWTCNRKLNVYSKKNVMWDTILIKRCQNDGSIWWLSRKEGIETNQSVEKLITSQPLFQREQVYADNIKYLASVFFLFLSVD